MKLLYCLLSAVSLFSSVSSSGCGGYLTGSEGTFTSPLYPSNYPAASQCYWTIQVPVGQQVQITITDFTLAADLTDLLNVYDGADATGTLLGQYSGTTFTPIIISTGTYLHIEFLCASATPLKGFSINWFMTTPVCGGSINGASGLIMSPGYPVGYAANQGCSMLLEVGTNLDIKLTMVDMEIETCNDCSCDYVEVRDGGYDTSPLMGRYCGTTLPTLIPSTGNQMFLRFMSDGAQVFKGFSLRWETISSGVCNDKCDFEDDTLCGWSSQLSPFDIQRWTSASLVPAPASGVFFVMSTKTDIVNDLIVPLKCSKGAGTISFKYYVKQGQQRETALEAIFQPYGNVGFQYNGIHSINWIQTSIDFFQSYQTTQVELQANIVNNGDIVAIDDICVTCCTTYCDFEQGSCNWLFSSFVLDSYSNYASVPKPVEGNLILVNRNPLVQNYLEVPLTCTRGIVSFKYFVNQSISSEAALHAVLQPSATKLFTYDGLTSGFWRQASLTFVNLVNNTKILFLSTLETATDLVAIDDVCVTCGTACP